MLTIEQGPIEIELTGIGAQCRGERHLQVISRQKEAINDLRKQVKQLLVETSSSSKASMPENEIKNHLIQLKKELAECRAAQALSEDIKKHANLSEGNEENFLLIEERTAHFETQNALEYSEDSFTSVMRTLLNLFEIKERTSLKTMSNLPNDQRVKLRNERLKMLSLISSKIKHLKESLERKEDILKDYELDLGKLRQAEFLLEKKTDQLDEFQLLLREKQDEIEFLQEALKNTRSELDREKLLNSTLKLPKKNISISLERSIKTSVDKLNSNSRKNIYKNNNNKSIDDMHKLRVNRSLNESSRFKNSSYINLTNRF